MLASCRQPSAWGKDESLCSLLYVTQYFNTLFIYYLSVMLLLYFKEYSFLPLAVDVLGQKGTEHVFLIMK